ACRLVDRAQLNHDEALLRVGEVTAVIYAGFLRQLEKEGAFFGIALGNALVVRRARKTLQRQAPLGRHPHRIVPCTLDANATGRGPLSAQLGRRGLSADQQREEERSRYLVHDRSMNQHCGWGKATPHTCSQPFTTFWSMVPNGACPSLPTRDSMRTRSPKRRK